MFKSYFSYFLKFIFLSKNRQRLLILAIVGLFISGLSLVILQSSMGGLQNKLMNRSKAVIGSSVIKFDTNYNEDELNSFIDKLVKYKITHSLEYEIELLLKYRSYLVPVIAHGIDTHFYLPEFLSEVNFKNAVIPYDVAYKIELAPPEEVKLISPIHTDSLLIDVPRSQTILVDKIISTSVPELDALHVWVRLPYLQNLIRDKKVNRIRLYGNNNLKLIKKIIPKDFQLSTWEKENEALVWALNLESTVMVFLFAAMSLLVSLCINSGLLIFFTKIKNDLSSFWILGASTVKIEKTTTYFLHFIIIISILMGIVFGIILLNIFDYIGPDIMPDVFVDRKIPILITFKGLLISFIVPYVIASFFVYFSLSQFKKEYRLLEHVRSI